MTTLTPAVATAVDAVREHFAGKPVEVTPDGAGGAFVIVNDIEVGPSYTPSTTWLGFQISAAYPSADVYPHYTGRLTRTDGKPHGQAIQQVDWQNRPAMQLSRRSNGWHAGIDNAALKAEKVITWLVTQ
ncbi:hypothetical protein [Micromonospora sp. CB01531]|uniref:hypothetical protein n=1 Tax=Micromonospora sp. CB01531 TaxID=1718947 RepID=UPI0009651026|nr:hypothetical protein [Micromonospora sp. CB01531]OKI58019.1 hypothetical protein A6A27_07225 [Micromonospora sp. CB01531]